MDRALKVLSQVFALICMVLSVWGLIYIIDYALVIMGNLRDPEAPLFHITYPVMALVNMFFFIALFFIGSFYLKGITKYWYAFIVLMALQLGYDFLIGYLWSHPYEPLSLSVAAATGVTGGGHVVQSKIYFGVWGSLITIGLHFLPLTRR
jgi:hypothetical protein